MRHSSLGKLLAIALPLALAAAGCENMGGNKNRPESGGRVIDRDQSQTTSPDGSAQRTRTQVRQTPSGATIRETETQKREVLNPGTGGGGTTR